MSRLQIIQETLNLIALWSRVLAVALLLLVGWVAVRAPNRRLRRECCRRHPGLSHSQWLSEAMIPLLYVTPLALRVHGVQWLPTTTLSRRTAGVSSLAWWFPVQAA